MQNYISVDRIEGEYAVLEYPDGHISPIKRDLLPENVKEGSLLTQNPDGSFALDEAAAEKRRKELHEKAKNLFGRNS
ncbi:MAG: DUF3006 domain-containing protein [Oscillospiraceae bacterium]|nr:DUF3006 domain-containing protein [Oscillospiraceae bacterium]